MCIIHNVELPVEGGPKNIDMGIIQQLKKKKIEF